jgi:hypothetical protein
MINCNPLTAERDWWRHSTSLYRAKGYIEHSASDLYKLDGMAVWDSDSQKRLQTAVQFITDAIAILNDKEKPKFLQLRIRDKYRFSSSTFYDHLADMIVQVILSASTIRSPAVWCWSIQHNDVWHELFNFGENAGDAGEIVKFMARRLMRWHSLSKILLARMILAASRILPVFGDRTRWQKPQILHRKQRLQWLHRMQNIEELGRDSVKYSKLPRLSFDTLTA